MKTVILLKWLLGCIRDRGAESNVVLCFTVLLAVTVSLFYVVVRYTHDFRPVYKGAVLLCIYEYVELS